MAKQLNTRLIQKVMRHIKGDLRRLEMSAYAYSEDEDEYGGEEFAKCGTKACFAGWAVLLNRKESDWKKLIHTDYDFHEAARKLLGLNDSEASSIFTGPGFDVASFGAGPIKQYAEVRKSVNEVLVARGSKVRV
jgi:hypothetical protein